MDESLFDIGFKACKVCVAKRREYKSSKAEHIKEQGQQNYQNHKEEKKQYYIDNKETIKRYRAEKINCVNCNCQVARHTLAQHHKSKKCQKHLLGFDAATGRGIFD